MYESGMYNINNINQHMYGEKWRHGKQRFKA